MALVTSLPRRLFTLSLVNALSAGIGASKRGFAQGNPTGATLAAWPSRPIRLVFPFAPGGPGDYATRILAEHLQGALGQSVVTDFRSGAGGNLGAQAIAQAGPDGHNLLVALDTLLTANPTLYRSPGFSVTDFTPIGVFVRMASVMTVRPDLPAATIQDLAVLARQHPLSFGSGGVGTPGHLYGEFLRMQTGGRLEHVPYRGLGPAVTDLLAGRLDLIIALMPGVIQHVASGRLRALAVTTAQRSPFMPEVPTLTETILPDFDGDSWYALVGPRGMPTSIVDILVGEVARFAASSTVRERLAAQAFEPVAGTPAGMQAVLARDTARWTHVIRDAKVSLD